MSESLPQAQHSTGCDCPFAANIKTAQFCPRHKVKKSPRLIYLCQNRPGYFEAWEEGYGPGQTKPLGLGDKVAKAINTATMGKIKPCGGCKKRKAKLNTLGSRVAKVIPVRKKNRPWPSASFTSGTRILHDDDLARDSLTLAGLIIRRWPEVDAIAGVPRSGMIAASHIATNLGLPLYEISRGSLEKMGGGRRMRRAMRHTQDKIVAVEDSINTGWSMETAVGRRRDPRIIGTATVYCTPAGFSKVDLYAVPLPLPHWFTWHMFGSNLLSRCPTGFDFDGILGHDCPIECDDDGERYVEWMESVPPLYLYRGGAITTIITARLEKYRQQTERWLARYGQQYGELVMGPWASLAERRKKCIGTWKAEMCAQKRLGLFVESDPRQAKIIHAKAKIPVMCPAAREVFA